MEAKGINPSKVTSFASGGGGKRMEMSACTELKLQGAESSGMTKEINTILVPQAVIFNKSKPGVHIESNLHAAKAEGKKLNPAQTVSREFSKGDCFINTKALKHIQMTENKD